VGSCRLTRRSGSQERGREEKLVKEGEREGAAMAAAPLFCTLEKKKKKKKKKEEELRIVSTR
jgi:hypothetical protein